MWSAQARLRFARCDVSRPIESGDAALQIWKLQGAPKAYYEPALSLMLPLTPMPS